MNNLNISYSNSRTLNSLTLIDESIYDNEINIQNRILEIKAPGQNCFISIYLDNEWCKRTLTCFDFQLCCYADGFSNLQDGIYEFKYSIDPNLNTIVEFQHLRVTNIMSNYIKLIGLYLSKKSEFTKKERACIDKSLSEIIDIINAAVYAIEDCLDRNSGIELYNEANDKINNFNAKGFRNCC